MFTLVIRMTLLLSLFYSIIQANPEGEFPVLYKGRFRPAEAYAQLWLYDNYHATAIKSADLKAFHASSASPLHFLWSLEFQGHASYNTAPLFWIRSAEMKKLLDLPLRRDRFSYHELKEALDHAKNIEVDGSITNEWQSLRTSFKEFERLGQSPLERAFQERFTTLQAKGLPSKEIELVLEHEYPLLQRLQTAGFLFKALPNRYKAGEWLPLKALTVKFFDPSSNSLKHVGNFTLFTDEHFEKIRQAYFNLENEMNSQNLSIALTEAYQPLAGQIYQQAHNKHLSYPTLAQLKIETIYVSYPWIPLLILLYFLGACGWAFSYRFSMGLLTTAILLHTSLLLMRCYILGRPPVSNMFETLLYVPWVAVCTSLFFPTFRRQPLVLLAACLTSTILLLILEVTDLNQSLDQVQAVLDSQFWLMIHVLLVVGSYGIFILGALLGHFYLGIFLKQLKVTLFMKQLAQMILQTMYAGTTFLVVGTILGGIWAAESWGRFWDWDPKESWAFISICFYLIWIHAYRFHRIASFGLAIGAVSGLLAISFTWYGVNYILGTGLHSYGFGSGGEWIYYVFLCTELFFLSAAIGVYFYLQRFRLNHVE